MDRLKNMKDTLISCIQGQMTHLDSVDTKELGEVIDMVKDLEEAIYYGTITEAMHKKEKEEPQQYYPKYYVEPDYPYYPMIPYERDMDRDMGRMYYNGGGGRGGSSSSSGSGGRSGGNSGGGSSSNGSSGGSRSFTEPEYAMPLPIEMRDSREGRSPRSRKMYMESKEMHHDKVKQMKELEKYIQELSSDVLEMIEEASPEEKQYLSSKMTTLASKISPSK